MPQVDVDGLTINYDVQGLSFAAPVTALFRTVSSRGGS